MFLTRPSVCQSVSQSVRQSCFSCQRNSSETAQQNFMKLCSYKGHNVKMCIFSGNFDLIFCLRITLFFELRNLTKMKDTTETVRQRNSSETAQQKFHETL